MIFYLPIFYTIKTRYNSNFKKLVYVLTYLLPEFMLLFFETCQDIPASRIAVVFALAILSYINIYELGYIYNDAETIKKEENPTKRLSENQLEYYEKNKVFIYFSRFGQVILLNLALLLFIQKKSFVFFCVIEIFTLSVYWVYNHVRGNQAMFFYFFLISARYISVTFCAIENFSLSIFIAALFVFPIIRTMEYKAHYGEGSTVNLFFRKYIIKYDVNKIPVFRLWSTLILLSITALLWFAGVCNWIPFVMCMYMFLYRFGLWLLVRFGANFNGYLKRS